MPEYADNYVLSTYLLGFLKERIYKDLGFHVRVRAFEKRVSGKQLLRLKIFTYLELRTFAYLLTFRTPFISNAYL